MPTRDPAGTVDSERHVGDPPLTAAQRGRLGGLTTAERYHDRSYTRKRSEGRLRSLDAWLNALDPQHEIEKAAREDLARRFRSLYASAMVTLRHSRNRRAKREAEAETVEAIGA
jgi:hypothetical protein